MMDDSSDSCVVITKSYDWGVTSPDVPISIR